MFDAPALAARRRRAQDIGPELFLHELALSEMLERLAAVRRDFTSALIVGWPADEWRARFSARFASVAAAESAAELERLPPATFDLCIVLGVLDTADDLPLSLALLRHALVDGGLLIGAIPGAETLPMLRAAMRAADRLAGAATPHVHPRIEAGALAGLLSQVGFTDPVVDIDRIQASYGSMGRLVADLRRMAATNVLTNRSRKPLRKSALAAATEAFASAAQSGRTTETFEILHFAAWTPNAE